MLMGRSLAPKLLTCMEGSKAGPHQSRIPPTSGSWATAPAHAPSSPPLAWYLCWTMLLSFSPEAEKLRYLVDSSWLGREEAWVGLKFHGGLLRRLWLEA